MELVHLQPVLIRLSQYEDQAHHEGDAEPPAERVDIAFLGREDVSFVPGQSFRLFARTVKYIANRPAKNINSLDSQTMVPTLTRFGRVRE
jgi:hypothetical protein